MQLTKEKRISIAATFDNIKNVTGVIQLFKHHFQGRNMFLFSEYYVVLVFKKK